MKRILYGTLPFLCMFFLLLFINRAKPVRHLQEHFVIAQKGLLSIPAHTKTDTFNISGLWHFTPNQFYCFKNNAQPQYAPFPGKLKDSSLKTDIGYGSYGLRIVGLNPNRIYALHVSHILSSCTISINGVDRAWQGQPGISEFTELPGMKSSVAVFKPAKNGTADIIINISNFHNRYGGTDKTILLGSAEMLDNNFTFDLIFYNIACTVLFVFSCFFILLHINYRKMSYILWFALTALTMSIRIASFYPHILVYILPSISWKVYFFFRYATIPVGVLFFTVFIKKILKIYYKLFYYILITICILSTLFITILSSRVASQYLYIQQAIVFLAALYNIAVIINGFAKKTENTGWIAATLCVLIVCALHDTLVSQWVISGQMLLQEGSIIAIIIIVIMSIDRYADSMHQIEKLAQEQQDIQFSLSRFIPNQLLCFLGKDSITEITTGDSSDSMAMTVLSIDIRSFTGISEQLQPDEVFSLINNYFATVLPIVRKHQGIIIKFLGDGFTALFSQSPDEALLCGIEIQQAIQDKKIQIHNLPPIQAGIAIDSGEVLIGIVGSDIRLDSIIISNTYYAVEDIQTATKKYSSTLVISEAIVEALQAPENYHIRCIQGASAPGKKNGLYEVYNSDKPDIQKKKCETAPYIEKAIKKIQEGKYANAQTSIMHALEIYPDDPLAAYYQKIIRALI